MTVAARVVALYRYPVKSFTPEALTSLAVGEDGRVVGDRVLGFRFADTAAPADEWSDKHAMLALVNTPGIARLRLRFDALDRRVAIDLDGQPLVEGGLDDGGRERISAAVTEYVTGLDVSGVRDRPERLPLRLVGDGRTPRHQDDPDPFVTAHSRASLAALRDHLGDPALDETRFRTNIVIDGIEAFAELGWLGRRVRIGDVTATVEYSCERCLATHVDPALGVRDRSVMKALVRGFGQERPTFAVALRFDTPGRIGLSDPVELLP